MRLPSSTGRLPRTLLVAVSALAALILIDRLRLLAAFGARTTDEDQTLLWYVTKDLLAGHLREPYFFGQAYGSWLEAAVAAPLAALRVPLRVALPIAGTVFGLAPWCGLAAVAVRRRRPDVAVWILVGCATMAFEGTILATLPRGLLPGITLACLAAVVGLWPRRAPERRPGPAAGVVVGLLVLGGASLNQGSVLVSGPLVAFLVLDRWRDVRWLAGLAAGAVAGGAAHIAAQAFYRAHPAYDLHPAPALGLDAAVLRENLSHLGRYLTAYAPEAVRSPLVPVLALGAVVALLVLRRRLAEVAAAVVAVVLTVAVLATPKADDGTASILLPFSRVYLALPWMIAALAVIATVHGRPLSRRAAIAAVAAACVAVPLWGLREAGFRGRLRHIETVAARGPHVLPRSPTDLAAQCAMRRRAAQATGASLVVERYDRVAAYGCGALLYGRVATVFPAYERRPWADVPLTGQTVLVSDADRAGCAAAAQRGTVVSCRPTPYAPLVAVRGYSGSSRSLLDAIGSTP